MAIKYEEATKKTSAVQKIRLKPSHLSLIEKTARQVLREHPNAKMDTENAVQNVVIAVTKTIRRNRTTRIKNLNAYLRRCAIHEALRIARENNFRQNTEISIDDDDEYTEVKRSTYSAEYLDEELMYKEFLSHLSSEERVFIHWLRQGMNGPEIVKVSELPQGSVYSRIHRLKQKLWYYLNGDVEKLAKEENMRSKDWRLPKGDKK